MNKTVEEGNPPDPKHALPDAISNQTTRQNTSKRGEAIDREGGSPSPGGLRTPTQPGSPTHYQANHHNRTPKIPTGQCHGRGFSDRIETHFHGRPFRNTSLHRSMTDPMVTLNVCSQRNHKVLVSIVVVCDDKRYLCFVS